MKEVRCPYCGREVSRGRYCIFCGNPLRSGIKETVHPDAAAEKRDDGAVWDPAAAYARSRGSKALGFFLLALFASVTALIIGLSRQPAVPKSVTVQPVETLPGRSTAFSPSCGILPGMTLPEMKKSMEAHGFHAMGDPEERAGETRLRFKGSRVLGESTEYSVIVLQTGEKGVSRRSVIHSFIESPGGPYSLLKRGPVFEKLLTHLFLQYGDLDLDPRGSAFIWETDGGVLTLRYTPFSRIELEYVQEAVEETQASSAV